MKRISLIPVLFSLCIPAIAQEIPQSSTGPLKFSDVVNQYETLHPQEKEQHLQQKSTLKGQAINEDDDKDLEFARWEWYWSQHLDTNGYMVSPLKNWKEWEKVQKNKPAQKTTAASNADWKFAGPDSTGGDGDGVGRINVVAFDPVDSNTYWIGSPGGGAWKTINNGASWVSMTDQLPLLSVSDIKFNPLNRNTVYLCTGDRDAGDYYSVGVLKSYNGGTSWNTTTLNWPESSLNFANSMAINPADTNTLLVGTSVGIYKSNNGGATWTVTLAGINIKQVLYNPADTNIVYAASYYSFSGGTQAQILRSVDGGNTWIQITSFTDAVRIALAVTPSDPSIVKAVVAAYLAPNSYGLKGIFNSSDSGHTFTEIYSGGCSGNSNLLSFQPDGSACGGQGWYDLAFAISPVNKNNVYLGGIHSWQSSDGGTSWAIMNVGFSSLPSVPVLPVTHVDKHFMSFNPHFPNRFFETNDGGIYWSDNPSSTSTWNNVTIGLGITEVYRIAVSNIATYELAGAQDNNTKLIQNGVYSVILGGDGMECQLDPTDTNIGYASSEYGNIYAFNSTSEYNISNNIPGVPQGAWTTPFVLQPSCPGCIIAGYNQVFLSPDGGSTWSSISPVFGINNLIRVVTSLSDPNTLYAVEEYTNNIYYTSNLGATWNTVSPAATTGNISDIIVDQFNPQKIWYTFSGYGSPRIMSYDPVNFWTNFNDNIPDVPVNCIQIDTSNQVMYAGTDIGVYYRTKSMTQWEPYQTGMPSVRVNDLQINYRTGSLWAATYGRSVWVTPKQVYADTSLGVKNVKTTTFSVLPNPNTGSFTLLLNNPSDPVILLRLIDNLGRTAYEERNPAISANTLQVNASGLLSGIYTLEIKHQNNLTDRAKIVIVPGTK